MCWSCPFPLPGAILFEETLYQDTRKGTSMVDELNKNVSSPCSLAARQQPAASNRQRVPMAEDSSRAAAKPQGLTARRPWPNGCCHRPHGLLSSSTTKR